MLLCVTYSKQQHLCPFSHTMHLHKLTKMTQKNENNDQTAILPSYMCHLRSGCKNPLQVNVSLLWLLIVLKSYIMKKTTRPELRDAWTRLSAQMSWFPVSCKRSPCHYDHLMSEWKMCDASQKYKDRLTGVYCVSLVKMQLLPLLGPCKTSCKFARWKSTSHISICYSLTKSRKYTVVA